MRGTLLNMRLAWRAAVGKNSARVSLFVRVIGVAFAVLVLLMATSASGALDSRGDRTTWRTQSGNGIDPDSPAAENAWMQVGWDFDYYLGHQVQWVHVVSHSEQAEIPPGLPRTPEPGEAFVSPALMRLIQSDPEVLSPRYADTIAGTISKVGLSDPNELVAVAGVEVMDDYFGQLYRELPRGFDDTGLTLFMWSVITVGVVVLLFPIAMFIASAARLNAQESDARLAAFRLAGASPQRVRWLVTWESLLAALPGALLGLGLFFASRPLVAQIQFDGGAFYPSDLALSLIGLLVLPAVPAVVVAASLFGLRDVEISPLGVSRQSTSQRIRPFGMPVMAAGFALLYFVLDGNNTRTTSAGLVAGTILVLLGVTMTGTWLGQVMAKFGVARAGGAATLLAFRRIARDPRASFRAVSGVSFAVFAGTLFLSLSAALEREVEVEDFSGFRDGVTWLGVESPTIPELENVPEGTKTVLVRELGGVIGAGTDDMSYFRIYEGNCDDYAAVLRMDGGCGGQVAIRAESGARPGDEIVIEGTEPPVTFVVPTDAVVFQTQGVGSWIPDIVVPAGTLPAATEFYPPILAVAPPPGVAQGTREFELVRTAILRVYPMSFVHSARQFDAGVVSSLETMRNAVYGGTFAAFILAGATAAMTVSGSIIARRKSFALLRMAGVPLSALRRAIITEATLPLALVSAVSAATAVAVSAMMIARIGEGSVLPPPEFILPLVAGLVVGLALPLITLPLLGRVTAMERTRFE